MANNRALQDTLHRIDGQGYGTYREIRGTHQFEDFRLSVDKVQVDPYAPPSLMRVILEPGVVGLPAELIDDAAGRTAVSDFLTRRFAEAIGDHARSAAEAGKDSAGKGSAVSIGTPGQQVLERTSVLIAEDRIEARIAVELPASGRRIRGRQAARILTDQLPQIVDAALKHKNLDAGALAEHVRLYRDQQSLREQLGTAGLVGFVGAGAILPRRSGDSDAPLKQGAVPFIAPDSLRVSFDLPSGLSVTGMGVPEGVTVIVGGGYHGKSTLLRALERGVYSHVAGDGREWVIAREATSTIRAEDGRAVTGVDISAFISGLPSGADTRSFSSENASGSTSQAANLVEALEAGSTALLIDEDTSATNFMIRDERMRRLIADEREPITPFIDRVRPLWTQQGVSTVLVAGGSGAFFDVADQVIALDEYVPKDVTQAAGEIARSDAATGGDTDAASDAADVESAGQELIFSHDRRPRVPASTALAERGKTKPATARGRSVIQYGRERVDLAAVAQLVDAAQTQAIAHAMDRLAETFDGESSLAKAVTALLARIDDDGVDALSPHRGHPGHLARPRAQEIHAAVNRYRHLQLAGGGHR
ncbi:ABC-ATPase domain-containing protein [Garicola koreensis]|uniref:Putative ABC-class ATPase n=1 Tax=Garicola koreensis TaxID=1262554 RepID=A0A7W5TRX8_9MICC|nr:ABC-ATPase domain-containing protein [Garicola koreensis]MBB3666633.1 putative ABC-class ATPase [Garicola koreensis]